MKIIQDYPFAKLCSLKTKEKASFYVELSDTDQIEEILSFSKQRNLPLMVLGEGTNIVPTKHFEGLIVKNKLLGIKQIDDNFVVSSGENWHDFVKWTIANNQYGLENLALIPGSVGAGPLQNIGAYGSEISDFIKEISVFNTSTGSIEVLDNKDCEFGYRTSKFKNSPELVILSVTFNLFKEQKINISYDSLYEEIKKRKIDEDELSSKDIFKIVCDIRTRVLPDHVEYPNVGSFFKNIIIDKEEFNKLNLSSDVPVFINDNHVKISSAFLIEKAGWKGVRQGGVGISNQHSLVLITYEDVFGAEILSFAQEIIRDVFSSNGLKLEIEPTLI